MNISHKVVLVQQGIQECVQASTVQLIKYYGYNKNLEEVKKEVPVYVNNDGVKQGTSLGHIATYFQTVGLKTTLHTSDIIVFDKTWGNLDNQRLISNLELRKEYVKHGIYDSDTINLIVSGYIDFLKAGGTISMPIVDTAYLLKYLAKGPLYMIVSYNVLNNCAKYEYGGEKQDSIKGIPSTHAAIISGYESGMFEIVDPDFEYGGYRKVNESLLIASYYQAQTDMDCMFFSFEK